MEIKTAQEIAEKYKIFTNMTPTDERYIWRTQDKWAKIEDVINWLDGYYKKESVLVAELIRHLKNELQKGRFSEVKK